MAGKRKTTRPAGPDDEGKERMADVPTEPAVEAGTGSAPSVATAQVDELQIARMEAEAYRAEAEAHKDRWLRAAAELDNFRRRTAREYLDQIARAGERILLGLLEPIENLARGIRQAKETLGTSDDEDQRAFVEGMELIHRQFLALLEREHVRPMEVIGQPFDPKLHEALMTLDRADVPENTVVEEIERGYWLGDRVLRHAKVGVARRPAQPPSEAPAPEAPAPEAPATETGI